MAMETKNPTSKKSDVETPQKARASIPGKPSTHANDNPGSSNPSSAPYQASSQTVCSVSAVDAAAATGGGDSKGGAAHAATEGTVSRSSSEDPITHVEKKLRRAERFGVPLQLSEQEKRNSRAERFGSGSGSDPSQSSEEQKRKARAERFGLTGNSVSDEESKKKARLARFGSDTKTDAQEEEKRKARALRFAQPFAGSLFHVNGKGNGDTKTIVASKAVGGT